MDTETPVQEYEIRVQGYLGQNTAVWFEGFTITHSAMGETILQGPIKDQAELHGLLNRIIALGLNLTLFKKVGGI